MFVSFLGSFVQQRNCTVIYASEFWVAFATVILQAVGFSAPAEVDRLPVTKFRSLVTAPEVDDAAIIPNPGSRAKVNYPTETRLATTQDAATYDHVKQGDLLVSNNKSGQNVDITLSRYFDNNDGGKKVHIFPSVNDDQRIRIYGNDLDFRGNPITITNTGGAVHIGLDEHNELADPAVGGFFAVYDLRGFRVTGKDSTGIGHPGVAYGIKARSFYAEEFANQTGVSDFEWDHTASYHATSSGYKFKNAKGTRDIRNVRIHHNLVYNSTHEGFYFGDTGGGTHSALFNWRVHNNILASTGLDAVQISRMVSGIRIYNNTLLNASRKWSDPNQNTRDALGVVHDFAYSLQVETKTGEEIDVVIDHNLVKGFSRGGQLLVSGDEDVSGNVLITDNVWTEGRSPYTFYLAGSTAQDIDFRIERNVSGKHHYQYDKISNHTDNANDALRSHVWRLALAADVSFKDNMYDTSLAFGRYASGWSTYFAPTPNFGSGLNVTETGTRQQSVDSILVDAYCASLPLGQLEEWTSAVFSAGPEEAKIINHNPVLYTNGDFVLHQNKIWQATGTPAAGESPTTHPDNWQGIQFAGQNVPSLDGKATNIPYTTNKVGYGYEAKKP